MESIYVIDCIMGSGKTSYAIRMLQDPNTSFERYIIVVPLLSEIDRWKKELSYPELPKIYSPEYNEDHNKTDDFKQMLQHRVHRIIITHAMFDRVDEEIISLLKEGEYILVLDEVPTPVSALKVPAGDLRMMVQSHSILIDDETGKVTWNPELLNEEISNKEVRDLCNAGRVFYNKNANTLFKISPYDAYLVCKYVFILTYMFEAQVLCSFFKMHGVKYRKFSIENVFDEDTYCIIDYDKMWDRNLNLKELIHICQNDRMNAIGKKANAFGYTWFLRNQKEIPQLKKNIFNFIRNICKAKIGDVMWTTFEKVREKIESRGFKDGFLAVNSKATNDYSDKTVVIYLANRFFSPDMKNYFGLDDDCQLDDDAYALSEMLQFIWRSAIRNGKPINLYIPSSRMRGLLEKWIEENSVTDVA